MIYLAIYFGIGLVGMIFASGIFVFVAGLGFKWAFKDVLLLLGVLPFWPVYLIRMAFS